uniref:Syndetin C-terminal domain-containing protein n=1 Tax=Leersia perrieri TaxID=77586 RepID=A0A0D9XM42_9ORYZ
MRGDAPPSSSSSTTPHPSLFGDGGGGGGELFGSAPGPLVFLPLLLIQGGGMDLSRVGEKLLSSVRSARSLGLLPPTPPPSASRPEVPARAAAAAAAARAIAGLPPHEKISLPSNSEDLVSIYGSNPQGQAVDELEEVFYEEEFDPIKYILQSIPEEGDSSYFDKQSTLRLAQLDKIAERLSHHVMGHHEEMVKGMQLVMELEQDLKVANVICMNGRRHISSSKNEVSRDLVVNVKSKKKQALLDVLPILTELRNAQDMQMELESFVEKENYFQAFQLLPEYLQILENYSSLSSVQEMGRGIEAWLARTIQKLDTHLLGVCQTFNEESYLTVIDAYALMGDIGGMAEKMQSFFLQEVLSQTHFVLKEMLEEEVGNNTQRNRFTYSDLCAQVPEPKFRPCLLKTLESLFSLMCSYYTIMSFCPEVKSIESKGENSTDKNSAVQSAGESLVDSAEMSDRTSSSDFSNHDTSTSGTDSPFYQLRTDATKLVAHAFERGRRNLWQLATSRLSVLLSSSVVFSTSTYQFLKNYEDLTIFILAGEAFCGFEASEFRQKLKGICLNYVVAFHRQNIYALKMVLEKESWAIMSAEASQIISLAGLTGDGAALISPTCRSSTLPIHYRGNSTMSDTGKEKYGFASWTRIENPFFYKLENGSTESPKSNLMFNSSVHNSSAHGSTSNGNRKNAPPDEENEDLLADFIDEDSQLPSRLAKTKIVKGNYSHWKDGDISSQTGSSLSLLRMMDKYARLMQKLDIVNVELFKGISQLFGIFYHCIYETFGNQDKGQSGKSLPDHQSFRLKAALSKITQDSDQWIKPQNISYSPSSTLSMNSTFAQMDVMPTAPPSSMFTSYALKERCAAAETILLVARVLNRSRAHLHSVLSQSNTSILEEFFGTMVDSVPDLAEHIHRTSARMLLHINGYPDKIANAKWEVKELGIEHNGAAFEIAWLKGLWLVVCVLIVNWSATDDVVCTPCYSYVDLLLGEFKHYKTRLDHGGISKELQDLLLEYGIESIAEVLVEGLSRVLINGLLHIVSANVRPKLQIVDTFIKAYYLPETEYVHWARSHPEYSKSQVVGLVNLVATMKGWKRKTRLETIERIEAGP